MQIMHAIDVKATSQVDGEPERIRILVPIKVDEKSTKIENLLPPKVD